MRLFKFDGDEANWLEWSTKTLSLAKTKGFRLAYATDTKPCSDTVYETTATEKERKVYETNDRAYQLLIISCTGIAFGLVNQAKTKDLIDGDAFMAWKNLCDRYAPHEVSDLIQLSSDFSNCALGTYDPDEWFIKLDLIRNRMTQINAKFEKEDEEVIAHILNKLPAEYSEVVTNVEGMSSMTLRDVKAKIRAFYKRKFKDTNTAKELAMTAGGKFKGQCRNCGKQGHKASECRSKSNVAGDKGQKDKKTGVKCFNCNKFAGHYAKDCPELKKTKTSDDKKETGMFVGMCTQKHECHDCNLKSKTETSEGTTQIYSVSAGSEMWLADTGATSHVTMNDHGMTNVENVSILVVVGDGKEVLCTKRGDILLSGTDGQMLLLKKVLYTNAFHKNIISIGTFVQKGNYEVKIKGSTLSLMKTGHTGQLDFKSNEENALYYFKGTRKDQTKVMYTETEQTTPTTVQTRMDINEAHDKFGHIGEAALRATLKSTGIEATGVLRSCEGCALAKARTKAIPKFSTHRAEKPGERLCTDISGPYKKSIIGNNYWVLVVDEYSSKSWSYFVSKKSELASKVTELVTQLLAAGYLPKYLRCDNAGENTKGLTAMCTKFNITVEMTAPYTPQQNGMVERKFVTIRDRSCAAMTSARFSDEYQGLLWAESVHTSTRLTNIVCNTRGELCPDEMFYGTRPVIYKHLIQFGRVGYMKLGKKQNKLAPKAVKCVMIGYAANHAGDTYRLYNTATKKVVNSRNVQWADWHGLVKPDNNMVEFNSEGYGIEEIELSVPENDKNNVSKTGENNSDNAKPSTRLSRELKKLEWNQVQKENEEEPEIVESINEDAEVHSIYSTILMSDPGEPNNYKSATQGENKNKWTQAIKSEIENFYKRDVWKKFPRSKLDGRKPLGSRWVFKIKKEHDNSIRYKARVVVKGYVQIPGVDFTDSFSPVATDSAMRTIFALTLFHDNKDKSKRWICEVIDVEAAFLEADMDENIYIEWPDGVREHNYENEEDIGKYCIQLKKAMYGTVQAALQWFKKLVKSLKIVGLEQSKVDPCIFYVKKEGTLILLIGTHVDDCAVAGKPEDVEFFKSEIKKHFTIKELGILSKHLGVWYEWAQDDHGRYIESSMEPFVEGMLNDFQSLFGRHPKIATTPGLPGVCLRKNTSKAIMHGEYRSMVGKILYFVKKVSPVCANACRELSQHLENPGDDHWTAVERLLGYLRADKVNRTLKMRAPTKLRVQDVVDSSFADNPDTRKSTSAYLGTIGGTALVNWISKGQAIVTMSSTEAEYVSLSEGAKETTFMTMLLKELMNNVIMPSIIAEDNTGAIFLSKNKQVGARTKHIDTRYHFVRDKVEEGSVLVQYVNTIKNPSDLLSKNVTQKIHDAHAKNISNGMMDCWNRECDKI